MYETRVNLASLTLENFLRELASAAPAPGGGSTAALEGSLASALTCMVIQIAGKKFPDLPEELLSKSAGLMKYSLLLVQKDKEAYEAVAGAYKLQKDTPEKKALRTAQIQKALEEAIRVPLETARACVEVLEICEKLGHAAKGDFFCDLLVAAKIAHTGLDSALLNVRLNLKSLKDSTRRDEYERQARELREKGQALLQNVEPLLLGALELK
ncbi:MAG: cyclodeaminase/cyclohydrolase family protein [Armatimonadetes bacterium]|nr:cyclodeaminase/cyclohydrolase family protein [Armatimonadota bacterium]